MAQQTAVEWLDAQLQDTMFIQYAYSNGLRKIVISIDVYMKLMQKAKQMEKEQIEKAFSDGQETPLNHPTLPHYSREEYYNDTYSKRQDSPDTDDIK